MKLVKTKMNDIIRLMKIVKMMKLMNMTKIRKILKNFEKETATADIKKMMSVAEHENDEHDKRYEDVEN